jgi:hypothetical protein
MVFRNDSNEFSALLDDERFQGEIGMWNANGGDNNVEKRMGWGRGPMRVGSVGKVVQTMGMARVR